LRTGCRDVSYGQQVEVIEVAGISHDSGKLLDRGRIGQVSALSRAGHEQVMPHQPGNHFDIGAVQCQARTEFTGINFT
jgi:hypothetical protein